MRLSIALLSGAVAVSAAQPHRHAHEHLHNKRDPSPVADVVTVAGPTEVVYVLNGKMISEDDVQQGIANGTLVWASDGMISSASSAVASSTAAPAYTLSSTSVYVAPTPSTSSSSSEYVAPPSSSSSAAYVAPASSSSSSSAAAAPTTASYAQSEVSTSGSTSSSGVNTPFPDGELDCGTFPSEYGAVAVSWMNLGGWTGVQSPGSSLGGFSNIETVTSSLCSGSNCCSEGMYCSYACPAGYQKSQWPTTQGATGQSVGGIKCSGGKLHLTNPSMSENLCMTGSTEVTVLVKNTMGSNAAICRTDYPGTEGETVPLDAQPGTTSNLTCPDADNYYTWEGKSTSAQYYVNPAGVSVSNACQWGSSANPWGNFAPLNLGVGYSNGAAWLSIFQNSPTTDAKLDFSIEIQGDHMSGTCRYSNGQYCGGANYDQCSPTTGCTVSVSSGTATFVLSS